MYVQWGAWYKYTWNVQVRGKMTLSCCLRRSMNIPRFCAIWDFVCKPEAYARSVQRCGNYMGQQMHAWKICYFGTWCHLSVLSKYSCDFLMCLLFLLFSTEWRWGALKTEVRLVGKGNISEQWISLEKAAQKSWGSLIKTQAEDHLPAWACRHC